MKRCCVGLLAMLFVWVMLAPAARAQDEAGDLVGRINALRAQRGLPGYSMNGALNAAAQQQAQWIVDTGMVSHTQPDGSGPRTRAVAAGYGTTDVSENIYGGTMANLDVAWSFWVNSPIHYNGIVNGRYREVGVGIARGSWGAAYVTVFGNPGGPAPFVQQASSSGGQRSGQNAGAGAAAAPAPPSYVVGQDASGNIMHEVQPGDTLGDIALIYGYTWDDLPYMMQLNGLSGVLDLEVGTIFLVPPKGGTFTPTPVDPNAATPTPIATRGPTSTATRTPTPLPTIPSPTPWHIATAAAPPDALLVQAAPTSAPVLVAAAPTEASSPKPEKAAPGVTIVRSGPSPWLAVALVVQVGILVVAGVEFARRSRRRK